MKVKMLEFEVEIKAKMCGEEYNDEDTCFLLNKLSLALGNSAEFYANNDSLVLSEYDKKSANEIFTFLNERGFYG